MQKTLPSPSDGKPLTLDSPMQFIPGLVILRALQKKPHVYAGTVPAKVKQRRRAAGRVAKQQRKINRKKG